MRSFIDTNVLVYADSADAGDQQSRASTMIAQRLRAGDGVISTRVLQKFVNAAIRKLGLPLDLVGARVRLCNRFETVKASPAAVLDGLDLHALHSISIWGALILQAARQSGCVQLLTQNLQAGAAIGGVRIVNPFDAPTPSKQRRSSSR